MQTSMEKIAFGSDLEIYAIDSKARIPIIYGNGNTGSINITIQNKDLSLGGTISFPLEDGQTLSVNDYIARDGLHIGEETIEFTSRQTIAYGLLQNITLYSEYTHIYSSDDNPVTMKVYYWSTVARDNQIYVLDKYEQLITVFNKDDNETLINPRVQKTQNAESIFTFSIDLHNPKWKEINNPENLYMVDGMMFSTNFDTSFQETISENDEKLMSVTAYERQKLLSRKFVRAWNSTTNIGDGTDDSINTFMVVVLAKGDLPLKNNGNLVDSTHLPGTSGYALDALLYGTGWTTGECDVGLYEDESGEKFYDRLFDLETDQLDIYGNILKVQELWGGILVFDSVNKIVHHRDETLWLPYEGYEVKYRKNMQSLEKTYNNKIITRLCPLGESGLNIKSVNNDSEWLENFSYTDSVLEGIENNPDITDPEQLKKWGERKLKDLCKPSKELTVETILLYQVAGYELETIDLNDIVDVINYNEVEGDIEQLRVVSFDYGVWDKSDAIIELSDITLDSTDIFRKTVSATNSINSGTLDASKVIVYFKNGQSVSDSIRESNTTIEQTKSDLTKTDDEIRAEITQTNTTLNDLSGEVQSQQTTISKLSETIDGLKQSIETKGGYNLLRNSVGYFGNEYWEGTIINDTRSEIRLNNEAFSAILLQGTTDIPGVIVQNIKGIKNGTYNISFNYKKLIDTAEVKVKISEVNKDNSGNEQYVILEGKTNETIDETTGEMKKEPLWTIFEKEIKIKDNNFRIEFVSNDNNSCLISDLILSVGATRQVWTQNQNETISDEVSIGRGIKVANSAMDTFTKIDADGNRIYNMDIYGNPKDIVTEMTDKGIETDEILVRNEATINLLFISQVGDQVWLTGI